MKPGILPGSSEERSTVNKLKDTVKELVDELDYVEVPVYTWMHECKLVVNGIVEPCMHLPYSNSLVWSFKPNDIVHAEDAECVKGDLGGKAVVLRYPSGYWELRLSVYKLARKKPKVIILTPGDHLKTDVVLGSPGLSIHPTTILPVCVVSVPLRAVKSALSNGIELEAKSRLTRSKGVILLARINGGGKRDVHIVTHHDILLGGFENTASSILPWILRKLRKSNLEINVVGVSYTAREIGDFPFTEYHFTWGERYLLNILDAKGVLDKVTYAIGVGPLHGDRDLTAHAHPVLADKLVGLVNTFDYNHVYMESHPYMEYGIPALTLTTLPKTWSIHNTDLQPAYTENALDRISEAVVRIVSRIKPEEQLFLKMRKHLYEHLGETRLEAKITISRLLDASERYGPEKGLRMLTRMGYDVFGVACTNPLRTEVFSGLGSVFSENALTVLEETVESCNEEVIMTTREYTLTVLGGTKLFLDGYLEYWLRRIELGIDYLVLKALHQVGE